MQYRLLRRTFGFGIVFAKRRSTLLKLPHGWHLMWFVTAFVLQEVCLPTYSHLVNPEIQKRSGFSLPQFRAEY